MEEWNERLYSKKYIVNGRKKDGIASTFTEGPGAGDGTRNRLSASSNVKNKDQ